jgi:hypothetical protein
VNRWAIAILIGAFLGLASAFACSFPDVTYAPVETAGTSGTPGTSGTSSGGAVDGQSVVVVQGGSDSGRIDASTCIGKCDCDDDGYLADACVPDANEDVRGKTPGDCDDAYDLRNAGYPPNSYRDDVPVGHDGDWNCDGKAEKAYGVIGECNPLTCDPTQGFRSEIRCGERSTLVQCKRDPPIAGPCVVSVVQTDVPQPCR